MTSKPRVRSDADLAALVKGRLARLETREAVACPDAEVLAAYVDGGLAPGEVEAVDGHLSTCTSCRAMLARLSPVEAAETTREAAAGWPRIDSKWLSLAAMLLVGVSLWAIWPGSMRQAGEVAVDRAAREAVGPSEAVTPSSSAPVGGAGAVATASPPPPLAVRPIQSQASTVDARNLAKSAANLDQPLARQVELQREAAAKTAARPASPELSSRPAIAPALAAASPPPQPAPVAAAAAGAQSRADRAGRERAEAVEIRRQTAAAQPTPPAAAPATPIPPASPSPAFRTPTPPAPAPVTAESPREVQRSPMAGTRASADANVARPADAGAFVEVEGRLRWRVADGGRRLESSSDGGATWNPSYRDPTVRLLAVSAPAIGVTWSAGTRGTVVRRVSPGAWARVTPPTEEDLVAIAATSGSSARVTSRSGVVFETSDGGGTWTRR